ncbi:MAG: thermonuclease family protein [Candidatus Zixiibacteriota bacterium]
MKRKPLVSKWTWYAVFILALCVLVYTLYPFPKGLRVQRVIDGDTIELNNGERVRYIGIDTPEKEEPFFREATQANQEMLRGKKINLEYDVEKKDAYGRALAYVWVDTLMVNAELVKEGLARVYMISPNLKYRNRFISLQEPVRKARIGIWSVPVAPDKYYVASRKSERFVFHRPECEWAKKIKGTNMLRFDTRDEALAQGYSPCRTCKP